MVELVIAAAVVVVLSLSSIRANARLRTRERLPMQWSFAGEINWTAPRRIALAFTPVLAAIVLGAAAIAVSLSGEPRSGQEGMGPAVILLMGLAFVSVHTLHLRLIERRAD